MHFPDIQAGNTGGTIPPDKITPKFKSTGPSLQFQGEGGQYIDTKAGGVVTTTVAKKKSPVTVTNSSSATSAVSPSSSSTEVSSAIPTPYQFTYDELPPLPPKKNSNATDEATEEIDLQ